MTSDDVLPAADDNDDDGAAGRWEPDDGVAAALAPRFGVAPDRDRAIRVLEEARKATANADTWVGLAKPKPGAKAEVWVQIEVATAFTARTVTLTAGPGRNAHRGEVQVSDDGTTFRRVDTFSLPARDTRGTASTTFAPVTARFFRVLFTGFDSRSRNVGLGEIDINGALRIDNWPVKAGFDRAGGLVPPAAAAAA